jgi:hypothetical protein
MSHNNDDHLSSFGVFFLFFFFFSAMQNGFERPESLLRYKPEQVQAMIEP